MVVEPTWSDVRGWIYGQRYIKRDGREHGSGFWNNEEQFEILTNPIDIIDAQLFYRRKELEKVKQKMNQLEKEINRIVFTKNLYMKGFGQK